MPASYLCRGGVPGSPGRWVSGTRLYVAVLFYVGAAYSTPFLWSCPKKWGGAPKKSAWGGGAPVRFRDPPASPTRVGGATRPLRCPLRGLISSLAAAARGWEMVKTPPLGRRFGSYLRDVGGRRPLQGGCDDGGARYTGVRTGGWNPAPTRYAHGSAHGALRRNPVGVGVLDDPNVGLPRGKIQRRYVKTRRRTRDAEEAGVARFIFSRLPLCCREPNIRARSALPAGSGADRGRARFSISSRSWPASFRFLSSSNASWQCPQSR